MNLLENQENPTAAGANPVNQDPAPISDIVPTSPPPPPPPSPPSAVADQSGGFGSGLKVSLMPAGDADGGSGLRRWMIILFGMLLIETIVIGGGYVYLVNLEADREEGRATIQQRVDNIGADIAAAEDDAKLAAKFDSRAIIAAELLDGHLFWTKFFKYLSSQTKKNVSFLNFSGDIDTRTVSLNAVGSSYRDVAEQIVQLRDNPAIEEVITTSAAARANEKGEVEGVGFSLVITLQPDIWLQTTESNSVSE